MEFKNSVTLSGLVGENAVHNMGEVSVARFGLCTERSYNGTDGPVVETTWHNVTAWEGDGITLRSLKSIRRGSFVTVTGRIRTFTYTTWDGGTKLSHEIIADSLSVKNF